jgi:hypothetical protein
MIEKPALTNLELHPIIAKRWSPRAFDEKKIEPEVLQRIFEAARWAPSSRNDQPWRFIAGFKGDESWEKIFSTLVDFNQKWAKLAPVLLLAIGHKISPKTGKHNIAWQYDVGQSVAYLTFQAMHEDVWVHQMGGLDTGKAARLFNVPDDFEVLTALALGYQGEKELLEESFQAMETSKRSRLAPEKLFFSREFDSPAF